MRRLALTSFGLAMAACATPASDYPLFSDSDVAARTLDLQRQVIDEAIERERRVLDLAWPLLSANHELCPKRRLAAGVRVGDDRAVAALVDGLNRRQVRALGYDRTPRVFSVAKGSPAQAAGLQPGDFIMSIGGAEPDGGAGAVSELLAETSDEPADLAVTVQRNGETMAFEIEREMICDVAIRVDQTTVVNATAGGGLVTINAGLLNALVDDRDIAFVIAHEIGHVAGRHSRKLLQNAGVSGFILWGPVLGVVGGVLDALVAAPLEALAGVETPPGANALGKASSGVLRTRSFEREADYVGLYFLARAGYSIDGVERVFEVLSTVSPRSTYNRLTHPVTPERILAVNATRAEIEAKIAANEELSPEGWPDFSTEETAEIDE